MSAAPIVSQQERKSWGRILHRGSFLVDRLADTVKDVTGTSLLKQALDAQARGNTPAAFWLLDEEFRNNPDSIPVCTAFWDVAVDIEQEAAAVPAAMSLIETHAARVHWNWPASTGMS